MTSTAHRKNLSDKPPRAACPHSAARATTAPPAAKPPTGPLPAERSSIMALSDIAAKLDPTLPHKTCGVCYWMAERGDEWAEGLRRLLRNRGIKFKDIADELADDPDEPDIPAGTLSRHAQRGCAAQEKLR